MGRAAAGAVPTGAELRSVGPFSMDYLCCPYNRAV
jgi:hypothetical protein